MAIGGCEVSYCFLQNLYQEKLAKRHVRLWVPEGRFSCDNASGCAALAWRLNKK